MSRFADARAVKRVDLGPCDCLGTPHNDGDWVEIRSDYSGRELTMIGRDVRRLVALDAGDELVADALAPYIVNWNLLGVDGKPCDPSLESVGELNGPTLTVIIEAISAAVVDSETVPNRSGAPSVASRRGSASRTPSLRAMHGT